ncbi:MAG: DMT family transporter, partial [Hymenobacteraceae bacterium]|nr:DMT family transporter [Hymenobacteraceae bacterium]MDX5395217.1 DMT family transporter [Hymenobacteraceae bacterium]MDX5511255.1 DMT family transporter [Hymenobacteraceae bacterium]
LGTALFFPFYILFFTPTGTADFSLTSSDWTFLLILSLVCTVYAYTASVRLMQRISAFAVNLSVNLEPIYGIILAFLIFGDAEKMSGGFYVGAGIILLSVFIYAALESYSQHREKLKKILEPTLPD